MPDTTDVTTTSTTVKIAGVDREFGFLNTYDKAEFTREFRKQRKAKLIENLKIAGADAETITNTLEGFEDEPPDFTEWLKDDEGKLFACRMSLKKKYPAEVDAIVQSIDLDNDELFKLTSNLFSKFVSVTVAKPAAPPATSTATYGDGGTDPNAQTPEPTYGTPAP
jgi:hypothetical protein